MNTYSKSFFKILRKSFGQKYASIEGDVNWKNGKIIDGRPHLTRHNSTLPQKNAGKINFYSSDYSELIKELDNKVYLTYNTRAQGVNKKLEIVLSDDKN